MVGMELYCVARVSVDEFSLIVGHSRVPDLDGAVFTARIQKLALLLKTDGCNIGFVC